MRWPGVVCLVVACALAIAGVGAAIAAESRIATRVVTADGLPMLEVSPARHRAPAPGIVVAHGFAGSARLMRGFADTLAARGYVAVVPDFPGHGSNPMRLPTLDHQREAALQRALDIAVRHLRTLASVDPARIALVGHSMGAGAVTGYAAAHPDIVATVAISLGSADDLPRDPARPRNLLLLVGAAEFSGFHDAFRTALLAGYPSATVGGTLGIPGAGTGRRGVVVPMVEHISILYANRTHAETAAWLDAAFGRPPGAATHPRDRLIASALVMLAFLVGMVPISAALLSPRLRPVPAPVDGRYAYLGLVVGLGLAGLGAEFMPTNRLPLAVGGYAAGFLLLAAGGLFGGWALGRRRPRGVLRAGRASPSHRSGPLHRDDGLLPAAMLHRAGGLLPAAVLTAYAVAAIAVPTHLSLLNATPVGARWWLLPVIVSSVAALLISVELLSVGAWWRVPVILAAVVVGLAVAAIIGPGRSFVLLVLPLLALLFAWHVVWSLLLRHRCAQPWLVSLLGAVVVGWPVAAALPVTG